MGKWTISMAIFTSKLFVYQRVTVMISEVSWIWWSFEDPLLCLTVKPLAEKSDVDPNGWGLLKVLTFQNSPCIHMCVYNNIYVCIVLLVHTYIHNIYIYIYTHVKMYTLYMYEIIDTYSSNYWPGFVKLQELRFSNCTSKQEDVGSLKGQKLLASTYPRNMKVLGNWDHMGHYGTLITVFNLVWRKIWETNTTIIYNILQYM